jgi:hypothetical protein
MTIRKWRPEGTKTKDDTSDEEVARRSKKRGKPAKEFRKRVRCCYESANNAESDRNRTRFSIHLRFESLRVSGPTSFCAGLLSLRTTKYAFWTLRQRFKRNYHRSVGPCRPFGPGHMLALITYPQPNWKISMDRLRHSALWSVKRVVLASN